MQENLNEEGLNNLNRALNCFSINNVQLRSARKTEALQCWKPIVQAVVDFLKERNDCFASLQILGTGSYYEKTKAGEPDEFDLMLVIDTAVDNVDLYEFRQSVPGVINDPPIGEVL